MPHIFNQTYTDHLSLSLFQFKMYARNIPLQFTWPCLHSREHFRQNDWSYLFKKLDPFVEISSFDKAFPKDFTSSKEGLVLDFTFSVEDLLLTEFFFRLDLVFLFRWLMTALTTLSVFKSRIKHNKIQLHINI